MLVEQFTREQDRANQVWRSERGAELIDDISSSNDNNDGWSNGSYRWLMWPLTPVSQMTTYVLLTHSSCKFLHVNMFLESVGHGVGTGGADWCSLMCCRWHAAAVNTSGLAGSHYESVWRRLHQNSCFLPLKTDMFCDEQTDLTLRLLQQESDGLGFFFLLTHTERSTAHREVVEVEVHYKCNISKSKPCM